MVRMTLMPSAAITAVKAISAAALQWQPLNYKNGRALSLKTFLDKIQKMFNTFHNEEEPMDVSPQVHELFRRVKHPQLQDTVKALEDRSDLESIAYSEADNRLTAAVSKITEYQFPQTVSGIKVSGGNSGGNSDGNGPRKGGRNSGIIYNSQGKSHTGY